MKSEYERVICTLMLTAVQFTTAKIWVHPDLYQWMTGSRKCGISTPERYSVIKKKIFSSATKWVQLKPTILSKIHKSQKTSTMFFLICDKREHKTV